MDPDCSKHNCSILVNCESHYMSYKTKDLVKCLVQHLVVYMFDWLRHAPELYPNSR